MNCERRACCSRPGVVAKCCPAASSHSGPACRTSHRIGRIRRRCARRCAARRQETHRNGRQSDDAATARILRRSLEPPFPFEGRRASRFPPLKPRHPQGDTRTTDSEKAEPAEFESQIERQDRSREVCNSCGVAESGDASLLSPAELKDFIAFSRKTHRMAFHVRHPKAVEVRFPWHSVSGLFPSVPNFLRIGPSFVLRPDNSPDGRSCNSGRPRRQSAKTMGFGSRGNLRGRRRRQADQGGGAHLARAHANSRRNARLKLDASAKHKVSAIAAIENCSRYRTGWQSSRKSRGAGCSGPRRLRLPADDRAGSATWLPRGRACPAQAMASAGSCAPLAALSPSA